MDRLRKKKKIITSYISELISNFLNLSYKLLNTPIAWQPKANDVHIFFFFEIYYTDMRIYSILVQSRSLLEFRGMHYNCWLLFDFVVTRKLSIYIPYIPLLNINHLCNVTLF